MDLQTQLSAGKIKRYHTITIIGEQTVADHSYGVVQILRAIAEQPISVNLMCAALDHDVLEYYTGDIPHPTKIAFPPIYNALKAVEKDLEAELGINYSLSQEESQYLKMADLFESGIFATHQLKLGNKGALDVLNNIIAALHPYVGMMQTVSMDLHDILMEARANACK